MRRYFINGFVLILGLIIVSWSAVGKDMDTRRVMIHKEERAALGVVIRDVDSEKLEELKLDGGAEIVEVLENSEAAEIGLQEDDIIINFDGNPVKNAEMLKDLVTEIEGEKTVELQIYRDGNVKSFEAKLSPVEPRDIHVDFDGHDFDFKHLKKLPKMFDKRFHFFGDRKGGYLGVYAENLSGQLNSGRRRS